MDEPLNIITLLGARFVGGIASFCANSLKELFARKRNDAKENKLFRRQLFGELISIREELINALAARDETEIEQSYLSFLLSNANNNKNLVINSLDNIETNEKKIKDLNQVLLQIKKEFISKIGQYICEKQDKTAVKKLLKQFSEKGLHYKIPTYDIPSKETPTTYWRNQTALYQTFWDNEINAITATIVECVMNNQ